MVRIIAYSFGAAAEHIVWTAGLLQEARCNVTSEVEERIHQALKSHPRLCGRNSRSAAIARHDRSIQQQRLRCCK